MIRAKWLVLVIATSLLLGACVPKKEEFICDPPSQSNQSPQSSPINIAIHVDGSASMLGYVKNPTSRYAQTLELLYNTFSLGKSRPNSNVEYYRSGNNNQNLTSSDFRKAQRPEFYDGSNPKFPPVTSALDSAITSPKEGDKLFVMVTDLYQNEGDVTRLNKKIQETYLNKEKKGYAAGLLAIRSEFNDVVYVDVNNFKYDTTAKTPDEFRPFYVMFLGPYSDVAYYFDKLKGNGEQLFEDSKFVIFSPNNLVSDISYIDEFQQDIKYIKQRSSLNDGNVALQEGNDQKTELLEIDRYPNEELLPIPYSVGFASLTHTLSIDPNTIKINKKIEAFDRIDKKFTPKTDDLTLQKALELSEWKMTNKNNELSFVTNIKPDAFQEPGVYKFTVDAVAQDLQEQSWWEEWNWNANRDSRDDGSKTHNLLNFLRGLKSITTELMQDNQPVIGRFCYAIQKN